MHENISDALSPTPASSAATSVRDVSVCRGLHVGSVCLRGGDLAALEKAKEILLYLTQVRLSLDREIYFYICMGLTSTNISLFKEPTMFQLKPRLLASSPNIIFGK